MNLKRIRTKPGTKQQGIWMRMINAAQWRAIYRLKYERDGQWSGVASLSAER